MNWVNASAQGILLGGLYALFACGLSLLFGVVRVVNLAHGDFAVLAAYLALVVVSTTHVPALLTFVIVAPLFAVFGYVVQRLIIQKSLDVSPLSTLLVISGLSVVSHSLLLPDSASISAHSRWVAPFGHLPITRRGGRSRASTRAMSSASPPRLSLPPLPS